MEESLKVRFAPSPTGFLHIGSARTALFNWLFAKRYDAQFILRIEDTDSQRSKKEYLDEILDSLRWLKLDWDNIFYQSKRLDLYREYAQKLVDKKKAYLEEGAVIFKYNYQKIEFDDLIRGHIEFNELPKDTEVIIKSDGTPTYNFACCVDDGLLNITHVIRGEDHIPNTPKQLLIYQALGLKKPAFAHLPMILSSQGGKLSKRFGATSIREYRQKGYMPEALLNYLLLLGWSPKDNRQLLSLEEVTKLFAVKDINKTAAAFSIEKLDWMNSEYIKQYPLDELSNRVEKHLEEKKFLPANFDKTKLKKITELFKSRMDKLEDLIDRAYFCFYEDYTYDDDTKDVLSKKLPKEIKILKESLAELENFDKNNIEKDFRTTASSLSLKARDLVHPVRVALSGKKVGPGLFETMEFLGKEKVLTRLERN